MNDYEYLLYDINTINGIGKKTSNLFKKKNINTISDLLLTLPQGIVDRTTLTKINNLQIGKIQTLTVKVKKYSFPRIRNLPKKVICEDETGLLDCVFFNSFENYIKKILPLNTEVTISGNIGYYKKKYQIVNPTHISTDKNSIKKIHSKYSLTDGLTQKKYTKIINEVLKKIPDLNEWHNKETINKFDKISWKDSIIRMHQPTSINNNKMHLKRLIYDEIFATLLTNSKIRLNIKKIKKKKKVINPELINSVKKRINFTLTTDQLKSIKEINNDLSSNNKMFRLLQGDVGSGKTIVALIASLNVIGSGYQVSFMAPTEILAKQHFSLAKKILGNKINIQLLTGKTEFKEINKIIENLKNNRINMLVGTHSLFQKK